MESRLPRFSLVLIYNRLLALAGDHYFEFAEGSSATSAAADRPTDRPTTESITIRSDYEIRHIGRLDGHVLATKISFPPPLTLKNLSTAELAHGFFPLLVYGFFSKNRFQPRDSGSIWWGKSVKASLFFAPFSSEKWQHFHLPDQQKREKERKRASEEELGPCLLDWSSPRRFEASCESILSEE